MEVIHAIRKLLFLEDCVIIPGLGGFVSQYRPAVIDKATGTFIPPSKEIVFNSELVQNDGTLVNFIAIKNAVSLENARAEVDLFVENTRKTTARNQPVFIDGIGHFILDPNREIRFQADPGANLFLDSFGLASFHLRQLAADRVVPVAQPADSAPEKFSGIVDIPNSASRKSGRYLNLRRIAIAMPLLIAFSLLPYNSRVTDTLNPSQASMIPEPSLFRLNYPDVPKSDTLKVIEFPIDEKVTGDTMTSDEVTTATVTSEEVKISTGKYPVIAGCFKVKDNADRLHKQLVDKGYPASVSVSKNGLYKVSVQSFATRDDAVAGLARLKQAEPAMQLWAAI